MTLIEALDRVTSLVGQDRSGRNAMSSFLRRLAHDLNNPLGTVALETYSLRQALDGFGDLIDRGDLAHARLAREELVAISDNLAKACEQTRSILDGLKQAAEELESKE